MTTGCLITGCLQGMLLALTSTSQERWKAAGEFNSNFMAERWFILIGVISIVILTALLFIVSIKRIRQERKNTDQMFAEYADKRGLSTRECQILLKLAHKAGLKQSVSIFTLNTAFDQGAARMIEGDLANPEKAEENRQLQTELSFLREKLGFKKQQYLLEDSPAKLNKLSSRQIPVNKKVRITRRKAQDSCDIESTVVRNNDTELAVKLEEPVKIIFGESWCVRYYFASSVWEFDTYVLSYDGDILVLNHSDNVRFINRRRFLRVPVRIPAFIAHFPFARTFEAVWGPPEFIPAIVTELGGPGLRIESPLEVKIGERILVVANLDHKKDLIQAKRSKHQAVSKIIENIGEVRHTRPIKNGFSIAVELTSLSDSNIDELIRATNAASLSTIEKNIPTSENASERVPEHLEV